MLHAAWCHGGNMNTLMPLVDVKLCTAANTTGPALTSFKCAVCHRVLRCHLGWPEVAVQAHAPYSPARNPHPGTARSQPSSPFAKQQGHGSATGLMREMSAVCRAFGGRAVQRLCCALLPIAWYELGNWVLPPCPGEAPCGQQQKTKKMLRRSMFVCVNRRCVVK